MEPKFHADWPKNRRASGRAGIAYNTLNWFSRFLDVSIASSMPHLIKIWILIILRFFTGPFYLVYKLKNLLKLILYSKMPLFRTNVLTAVMQGCVYAYVHNLNRIIGRHVCSAPLFWSIIICTLLFNPDQLKQHARKNIQNIHSEIHW